jgi:hypothetical protein
MNKFAFGVSVALAFATLPQSASALVNLPVPRNAYITIAGLDWVWASPCGAYGSCGDIDLTYQGTQGWRLPTVAEFAFHPTAAQFVFPGANVPAGGSDAYGNTWEIGSPGADATCAATYFSPIWSHCDWGDGIAGNWYDPSSPNFPYTLPETLLVRATDVPEPASWALMIAGFGMVGFAMRRRILATA